MDYNYYCHHPQKSKCRAISWISRQRSQRPEQRGTGSFIIKFQGMGFFVTTLIFVVVGIIASICTRICCNRGPSTNLLHLTLVLTATVCCWMMWAIVYLAQMKPLIVPILSEVE
uniref:Uncharacterized protein n=1 Tax=Salix viminalis TaxID=40686 RepID=A0A6N2M827_SALVM